MDKAHNEAYHIPILDDLEEDGNQASYRAALSSSSVNSHEKSSVRKGSDTQQAEYSVLMEQHQPPSFSSLTSAFSASPSCKASSFSLPILRSVEVVPPVIRTNFLDALIKSDPRVAFDSLHIGVLECMTAKALPLIVPKEGRKRPRSSFSSENECSIEKMACAKDEEGTPFSSHVDETDSNTPSLDLFTNSEKYAKDAVNSYFFPGEKEVNKKLVKSLTAATVARNATLDLVVEVSPLHRMVSERPAFKVDFDEIEKVLHASKKKDVKVLLGEALLEAF